MAILNIPEPVSIGLLLSYKCNISCRDCIYACSPKWKSDWINIEDVENIFNQLAPILNKAVPGYSKQISFSYGLHFTGGEPFLNFSLLLKLTYLAKEKNIPLPFVETNCFWATDDKKTKKMLIKLKKAGLSGILISVNPFNIEYIPFERIKRAAKISQNIFGPNSIIYQQFYFSLFKQIGLRGTISFKELLKKVDPKKLQGYIELLPMGNTLYKLDYLYERKPADFFFGESCHMELTRNWHLHIDNYCNYIPGFCAGISLGNARNLKKILAGMNLENFPILQALNINLGKLYEIGKANGYRESSKGYISKCHLCTDIRKHLVDKTDEFKELKPIGFYKNIGN